MRRPLAGLVPCREKNGRRYRGKSSLSASESDTIAVVLAQPHRVSVPEIYRRMQLAASPIGRLRIAGKIDDDDLTIIAAFRRICHDYRVAICSPRPIYSNADLEHNSGRSTISFDTLTDGELSRMRDRWDSIRDTYNGALAEIRYTAGSNARLFIDLVVSDYENDLDVRIIRGCLRRLDLFFRSGKTK